MKTIAILSQKGGAGKTTLAVHLAVAAEKDRKTTALIDLDPQASATSWGDSREQDTPIVISAQATRLPNILATATEQGADLALVDTAPHSEKAALQAARTSDLVLIPCRPAIFDLRAIGDTVELIKLAKVDAVIVLNGVPPRGRLADEAIEAVSTYELPVLPVRIGQRAAFTHAVTVGQTAQEYEPSGKAAAEIKKLYKLTKQHVKL